MGLAGNYLHLLTPTSSIPADFAKSSGNLRSCGAACMKPSDSLLSLDTQCPIDDEDEHVMLCEEAEAEINAPCLSSASCTAPSQTVLYLDFDDTLFPTTELMDRRHVLEWGRDVPEQVEADLRPWREALKAFLDVACSTSSRCVILTNAKRPWVDVCIDRFAPELRQFFSGSGGLRVVYADEALKRSRGQRDRGVSRCLVGLATWLCLEEEKPGFVWQKRAEATAGKRAGMEREALDFYGAGEPWENVLSVGDAAYERNALLSLIDSRGARRAKHIAVPTSPTLECIVESLRLLRQSLPIYADFDGHLDLKQRADGSVSTPDEIRARWVPTTRR